jgi:hypothetical protein
MLKQLAYGSALCPLSSTAPGGLIPRRTTSVNCGRTRLFPLSVKSFVMVLVMDVLLRELADAE